MVRDTERCFFVMGHIFTQKTPVCRNFYNHDNLNVVLQVQPELCLQTKPTASAAPQSADAPKSSESTLGTDERRQALSVSVLFLLICSD